jgi:GxxExxY protein
MKYGDITHKIIGCAMKVHTTLGNGFQEVIYQRALAIEMSKQGLGFEREMEMEIFYEGEQIGTRRVDFFVEDSIMVELKALIKLEEVHLAQAMNYCQAYNLPIGLLINFGSKSLEFKRVYNLNHPENKKSPGPQILSSTNPKNVIGREGCGDGENGAEILSELGLIRLMD